MKFGIYLDICMMKNKSTKLVPMFVKSAREGWNPELNSRVGPNSLTIMDNKINSIKIDKQEEIKTYK